MSALATGYGPQANLSPLVAVLVVLGIFAVLAVCDHLCGGQKERYEHWLSNILERRIDEAILAVAASGTNVANLLDQQARDRRSRLHAEPYRRTRELLAGYGHIV